MSIGKSNMVSLENEDFEFDVCKDDGDELCKSNYEDEKCCCTETLCCEDNEAKNKHGISILMNVNSNDAGIIRDALIKAGHVRMADDFETRRELGIMHEVKEKGLLGTFESWSKDTYGKGCKKPRYKMKHKILAK
jgi:hypothetical protein